MLEVLTQVINPYSTLGDLDCLSINLSTNLVQSEDIILPTMPDILQRCLEASVFMRVSLHVLTHFLLNLNVYFYFFTFLRYLLCIVIIVIVKFYKGSTLLNL